MPGVRRARPIGNLTPGAAVVVALLLACKGLPPAGAPAAAPAPLRAPARPHARCGWIARDDRAGVDAFVAHAAFFDAIHPKWYRVEADGPAPLPGADDARVLAAAREHGVAVMPVVAAIGDPAPLRALLRDPARRDAHVAGLVALAVDRGYAGLDIDYEGLWGHDDRVAFQAFASALATAMHAAGKQLTAAVPGLVERVPGDRTDSPYAYGFLAEHLDRVHLMAYDFHHAHNHAGPVAPQGWVEAVIAHAAATGRPERFLLGLPNYGVAPGWSGDSRRAAALCAGGYAIDDDHMATCALGHYDAGRAPHCASAIGRVDFDDLGSLDAKVAAAARAHLGGVTYWHTGGEPDGFFEMIEGHFPR
jgi:spore germination protein YaaH